MHISLFVSGEILSAKSSVKKILHIFGNNKMKDCCDGCVVAVKCNVRRGRCGTVMSNIDASSSKATVLKISKETF